MCFGVCLPDCPLQTSLLDFTCNSNYPAAKGRRAAWRLPGWMPTFMTLHQTGGSPDVFFVCVFLHSSCAVSLSFGQSVVRVGCQLTLLSSVSPASSHWHCCCCKSASSNLGNYPVSDLSHHTAGCCLEHASLFLSPSVCSCKHGLTETAGGGNKNPILCTAKSR